MRSHRLIVPLLALSLCLAVADADAATPVPAWDIQSIAAPTNFLPGEASGEDSYQVFINNSGGAPTNNSTITITDTLPKGIAVKSLELRSPRGGNPNISEGCAKPVTVSEVSTISCEVTNALQPESEPARLNPGNALFLEVKVVVPPSASGKLLNRVEVSGGGAALVSTEAENEASPEDAKAGFEEFKSELTGADGKPVTGADSHPYQYTTTFAVNTVTTAPGKGLPLVAAGGNLREVEVALPPGLAGNPTATERCTAQQFAAISTATGTLSVSECPDGSAVGLAIPQQLEGATGTRPIPLYNLVPPRGMPAQFGFEILGAPIYVDTRVRSDGDYGITAYLENVTEASRATATRITLWGTPWEANHDSMRGFCAAVEAGSCPVDGTPRSIFRLPSSCVNPLTATMSTETWAQPPARAFASFSEPAPVACSAPPFTPTIEAKPTTGVADSPSGLHFKLHLPVAAHETGPHPEEELGEADLRDASVVLPEGLAVNPASATGRAACTTGEMGLLPVGAGGQIHFDKAPAACPDASKIGVVSANVPALDHPIKGSVFLASQEENPFDSLLAIYIVLEDPESGIVVKLAGKVTPDAVTARLTTTVLDAPQVPVEDFEFDFFDGARASLRTPATCGTFSTTTSLVPWTSPEGSTVTPSGSFQVTGAPGGGACPSTPAGEPNAPGFEAGTTTPVAGAYSPLVVHLTREDGAQNFSGLNVTLPPGATGKLAGIPECSEAQIAAAQGRSHPREGAAEQARPSCPASSMIGTATVGAGAGPSPLYVTGKAYLAGPYKGAPFSLAIITPAVAGPFDLGTVVVRAGLYVNPSTAQVTTKSDPIPSILQGIPLDVRSITVNVDRPGFILNPTSCNPLTVTGQETSTLTQTAPLSGRFQVGSCQNLKFTPKLTVSTTGKTSKASGASLTVKVAYPSGSLGTQANIGRVDLQLPKQLPARLSTLQKACTEAQFNTNPAGCPTASMIGTAKAITPVLSSPLTGPAILVSHGGAAFPDVEFLLQGEGVLVILDGKTQIKKGITYSHFETVPDQPITTFETTFPQGPYSVLATDLPASAKNSLCGQALNLPTTLTAQNGALITQNTKATITGCAKTKTLTRAQKLTLALKACHKKPKGSKRKACEHQAHKKYGPLKKTKQAKKK
ncbi:MAG: hypothetical protein WB709_05785 [Solirubrobacteraceae bacterium]